MFSEPREDPAMLSPTTGANSDRRTFAYVWLAMDLVAICGSVRRTRDGCRLCWRCDERFVPVQTACALEIPNANEPPDQRQNFMIAYDHGSGRINDCAAARGARTGKADMQNSIKGSGRWFVVKWRNTVTSFVMHTKLPSTMTVLLITLDQRE